jgi:hypothetical protein
MNIWEGLKILTKLRKVWINTQHHLTYLVPSEANISIEDKERLQEILSLPQSQGISVYASKENMGFMNGTLFRQLNNLQVAKKHRIQNIDETLSFLNEQRWNYRAYHATFTDEQIQSSLLIELTQQQVRVWIKDGNVWDYNNFEAPLIALHDIPEYSEQIQQTCNMVRQHLQGTICSFILEGKITSDEHPNGAGVMIADICEGYENPQEIIPNHTGIAILFEQYSKTRKSA